MANRVCTEQNKFHREKPQRSWNENIFNEIEGLWKAENSLSESIEASPKAFDMFLIDKRLENEFLDNSVKATIQLLYDIGLSITFDKKDEILKEYFTFY